MNRISLLTLASLVTAGLAAHLSAQGSPPFSGLLPDATYPSDHAPDLVAKTLTAGATYTGSFPFSWGKARQMVVYESHDLKIANAKKITHLGFQRHSNWKSLGYKVQMKVFMGKSNKTAKTAVSTFAQNYDGSPTNVFGGSSGGILSLPDLGDSLNPNKDRPFVWLPLASSYVYDNTKNLVVDYHTLANSNSSKAWNYYLGVARFLSPVTKLGIGCKDSGSRIPLLKSRPTAIGSNWYVDLSNAPGSSASILWLSFGKLATPWPFPARLDCNVYIDFSPANFIPVQFLKTTGTTGRASWSFAVPDIPSVFNNLKVYSQATMADVFSPNGVVFSNGDQIELGMHPQMTIVGRQGDPSTLTTGSVSRNRGVISHFKYQ